MAITPGQLIQQLRVSRQQGIAPALHLVEVFDLPLLGAMDVVKRLSDSGAILRAQQAGDMLQLTLQGAAFESLRIDDGRQQRRRQLQPLQAGLRQVHQLLAEVVQGKQLTLELRLAFGFGVTPLPLWLIL
jgi:hypothetical protein